MGTVRRVERPGDDPTLEEMREYLAGAGLYDPLGYDDGGETDISGLDPDAEAAIYWFAADYHGGQWSALYSALSASPYTPGPCAKLETEGELAGLCYAALRARFIGEAE